MRFLRTASSARLLAVLCGVVVLVAAGAAISVAASGRGPVPARASLSTAVHRALTAKPTTAISGRFEFTNALIDSSNFQGSDPILQGASGRFWVSGGHRLRLELQSANGDAQIVLNGRSFWFADPAMHVAYQGTLPADVTSSKTKSSTSDRVPTVASIQSELNKLMGHLNLSTAIPGDIAGHPTYTVHVAARHAAGLLGQVQMAWDAARGLPLRLAIYAKDNPKPVLQLQATNISYASVPASAFDVSPPTGTRVVKIQTARLAGAGRTAKHAHHAEVTGMNAVAAKLPFKLQAPNALIGLPRQSTRLLDWGGEPAALVTYGQGLGGIAVIEQTRTAKSASLAPSSSQGGGDGKVGFSLPTVTINGASGTELDTALGTVIRWSSGGVTYTLLGSVPSFAAAQAARAL